MRDLLLCAKHLFVAAISNNLLDSPRPMDCSRTRSHGRERRVASRGPDASIQRPARQAPFDPKLSHDNAFAVSARSYIGASSELISPAFTIAITTRVISSSVRWGVSRRHQAIVSRPERDAAEAA